MRIYHNHAPLQEALDGKTSSEESKREGQNRRVLRSSRIGVFLLASLLLLGIKQLVSDPSLQVLFGGLALLMLAVALIHLLKAKREIARESG